MRSLALHDCEVTAARGFETPSGLAFSGLLWVRGIPVAEFDHDGNGGCITYRLRPAPIARVYWREFEDLARRIAPVEFEHADHVTGALWDWALLRDAKQPTTAAVKQFFGLHVLPYEAARDAAKDKPAPNEWLSSRGPEWLAEISAYVTIHGAKRRGASQSDKKRHAAPRKQTRQRPS